MKHIELAKQLELVKNSAMINLTDLLADDPMNGLFERKDELRLKYPFNRYENQEYSVDRELVCGIKAVGWTDAQIIISADDVSWAVPMNELDVETLVSLLEQLEK